MSIVTEHGLIQRREALVSANDRRVARAVVMEDLRAGGLDPVELVLYPPEALHGMFLLDLLRKIPKMGMYRLRRLNRLAIRDGVNLVLNVEDLAGFTREWLEVHLRVLLGSPLAERPQG